jgi:hypothetical protein
MTTIPPGPADPISNADLERALQELGKRVTFPATPDLAVRVRAELAVGRPEPLPWWRALVPARPVLTAAAVALLIVIVAFAAWPQFRTAVADRLGVSGIRIVFDEETPTPVGTPVGSSLLLGERTTLGDAAARVGYDIHVPEEALGEPDEVYLRALPDGNQMVSFLYLPAADLPETAGTGAAALLIQFSAGGETMYLAKNLAMDANMMPVTVNGGKGWWIRGSTNLFLIQDPSAVCCGPLRRPGGSILLWEQAGLTFRLEADLPRSRMLEIAGTIRPVGGTATTPAAEP